MTKKILLSLTLLLALVFFSKKAAAQYTLTWAGGATGSWNSSANWSISGLGTGISYPGNLFNNDVVIINSNVNISVSALPKGSISTLTLGNGAVVTLTLASGMTLTITGGMTVGGWSSTSLAFAGSGAAAIGGSNTFDQYATLSEGASGTLSFTSGSSITFNNYCDFTNAGTVNGTSCAFTCNGANNYINNSGTFSWSGGSLNFTGSGTGAYVTNSGTMTLSSSCTLTLGNNTEYLQNSGTLTALSSTFNLSGSGAYMTNSSIFKATGCTFTFGNGNNIQNLAAGTFTAQPSCIFTMNTTGSYVTNAGTWTDHGSTYTMEGQNAYIKNTNVMKLRGAAINFATGGGNAQNINNSGTITIDSVSTITENTYTSYITNSGTFYAGTSNSSCVISLTAQSAYVTNSSIFYLGSTSIIYPTAISTYITNQGGGTFTLQSDQFGSAAIGPLNSTAGNLSSVNGSFAVQRYYQGSTLFNGTTNRWLERNYRIISSPVTNATVSGVNTFGLNYIVGATAGLTTTASSTTNAFITGCTGGSTSAGNPSIYLYRESYTPSNATFTSGNFLGITNITNSTSTGTITCSDGSNYELPAGTGVFFFDRGQASNWSTRTKAPYIAAESVTLTTTGTINTFSVNVRDWYTPSSTTLAYSGSGSTGNYKVRGFNMVGNPYPCTIDWCTAYSSTGITRSTTVGPTIWTFDPQNNQYATYIATSSSGGIATGTGSRYIMSGQGFFVQALPQGSPAVLQTLTFTESAKAAAQQLTGTSLLMGTPVQTASNPIMRLKVMIDSINYDDIALVFNSSASTNYNSSEDAPYIRAEQAPEGLSSFSDDSVQLSINSLPLPGLTQRVIRLKVDATYTGTFTMQKTQLDQIPKLYQVWLMDYLKKDSLDMRANSTYIFDVNTSDTTTYGANRFALVIRQDASLMVHLLNFNADKVNGGSQVQWVTENEENYTNFTLQRSTDGGNTFTDLYGVASSGQGTYSFLDQKPANGANSYRLKIVDLNGTISYSNVVTLMYAGTNGIVASNIRIYPNPAVNIVNLDIDQSNTLAVSGQSQLQTNSLNPGLNLATGSTTVNAAYEIKIINIGGTVVKTAASSQPSLQQNIADLTPGTYVLKVVNTASNTVVGSGTFIKL